MFKNKKILIILFLVTTLFSNVCFATSNTINYNNQTIKLTQFGSGSNDTGFLLYDKINDKFVLFGLFAGNHGACIDSTKYYVEEEDSEFLTFRGECEHTYFGNYYLFNYDIENGCITSLIDSKAFNQAYGADKLSKNQYICIYKNIRVYEDNTYTTLYDSDFFFQPGVLLGKAMTVEEIPIMITQLLTILVPVGLTIFGMLLLLYLLGYKKWRRR